MCVTSPKRMNNSGQGREGVERTEKARWPSSACRCMLAGFHLKREKREERIRPRQQNTLTVGRQSTHTRADTLNYLRICSLKYNAQAFRHFTCPLERPGLNKLNRKLGERRKKECGVRVFLHGGSELNCTSNPATKPLRECMSGPERF